MDKKVSGGKLVANDSSPNGIVIVEFSRIGPNGNVPPLVFSANYESDVRRRIRQYVAEHLGATKFTLHMTEDHGLIDLGTHNAGTFIISSGQEQEPVPVPVVPELSAPLSGSGPFSAALIQANRERPPGMSLAVLYIDPLDLKAVNAMYGRETGDAMLVALAQKLQLAVRGHDLVAKDGGPQFLVLLTRLKSFEDAQNVRWRISKLLSEPVQLNGVVHSAQTSIGLAFSAGQETDPERLVAAAVHDMAAQLNQVGLDNPTDATVLNMRRRN